MKSEKEAVRETEEFYNSNSFDVPKQFKNKQEERFKKLKINFPETGKAIDVGAGSGRSSRALRKMRPNLDITCLDIAKKSIDRLKEFKRIHASALNIPFEDETFDVVISVGCLHHTPNAKKGFEECCRILKPGGILVIALYNKWTIYPILYKIGKRLPGFIKRKIKIPIVQDQFFTPHASFHSPKEVKEWFEQNGIEFKKLLGTGYITPYFPNKLCQFIYYYGIKKEHKEKQELQQSKHI
ncbi:class I SAM-dependent methyltransferase [Candidatus Woesearchaeota archaeon]|nr:MAG: class I SAM-dependent methyltransferase [Candidatus Woesearchaeota archaeon]